MPTIMYISHNGTLLNKFTIHCLRILYTYVYCIVCKALVLRLYCGHYNNRTLPKVYVSGTCTFGNCTISVLLNLSHKSPVRDTCLRYSMKQENMVSPAGIEPVLEKSG